MPSRCRCGAKLRPAAVFPIRCDCGQVFAAEDVPPELVRRAVAPRTPTPSTPRTRRRRAEFQRRRQTCDTCPAFGRWPCSDGITRTGCGDLRMPCHVEQVWGGRLSCPRGLMPDKPKRFGGRVGFLAVAYLPIGGTEVWHRTLIPRLEGVAGFVCTVDAMARGDFSLLGCPTGVGLDDARELAASCDVLVVWGIGSALGEILPDDRPAVVSVSHCDARSPWTVEMMAGQAPWTDHAVHLCPTGRETVPQGIPATWIPNAPDPRRVIPTRSRQENRRALGVDRGERLVVITARLSPEKQIDRVVDAVGLLGEPYRLVVAGESIGWNAGYREALVGRALDNVRIIAPVERPGDLLTAADLVVSASEIEGYGLATAEAMVAGVPTIATPCGFLEEAPELSRLIPIDATPSDWAAAIADDFEHPEAMRRRADHAREFMTSTHSVDRFARDWSELVKSVRTGLLP